MENATEAVTLATARVAPRPPGQSVFVARALARGGAWAESGEDLTTG